MKKKIGLIVDSLEASKQINDLILMSFSAQNYEISTVFINDLKTDTGGLLRKCARYIKRRGLLKFTASAFLKFVCKIESSAICRVEKFKHFYDTFNLSSHSFNTIHLRPNVSKNGLVYRYEGTDIEKVKQADVDLLVRAGSGILKGEILKICPNGVISFHHADNDINRGTPPGFWEVYHQHPRTGFIIQRLTEELDGGDVLYKGYIPTSWFYSLNLAKIYEVSNRFLHDVLEDLTSDSPQLKTHKKVPYDGRLYSTPNVLQIFHYLFKTSGILAEKVYSKITGRSHRWGVAYQFTETWNDVTLWRSHKIPNPKNRFLADPFPIKQNGRHYCFVEDFDYATHKGKISVYEMTEDHCQELGEALTEEFHLSFPYLFEYEGGLYMCPETHEAREIRLYRCVNFPLEWELHTTIMKDVSASDSVIFFHEDRWWLLTNIDESPVGDFNSQLHVFSNSTPLSDDWTPHQGNPVIFDPLRARNGGLIRDGSDIFRIYQRQDFDFYGKGLGVAKLLTIEEGTYCEEVQFEINPEFFTSIEGTHTYNYCDGLLVFDYVELSRA
ncbi:hypothetical protein LPB41_22105 [Thalassospira sp. MA62]|nr:hypothetical protein [Thalassospira sp. MA62]